MDDWLHLLECSYVRSTIYHLSLMINPWFGAALALHHEILSFCHLRILPINIFQIWSAHFRKYQVSLLNSLLKNPPFFLSQSMRYGTTTDTDSRFFSTREGFDMLHFHTQEKNSRVLYQILSEEQGNISKEITQKLQKTINHSILWKNLWNTYALA